MAKTAYHPVKAILAMARASFISTLRSPAAVVFTLAFPLIFILVFGFIGGGGITVDVGLAPKSDTANPVYQALKHVPMVKFVQKPEKDMQADLEKGRMDALLNIRKNGAGTPAFVADVTYTRAAVQKGGVFRSVLTNILYSVNRTADASAPKVAEARETTVSGREYKTIDFILPGQLGFSLLSTGVFGTAFVFVSLRITLVIKRFFATPAKRYVIVLGEALSRIGFALIGALFIILVGHFAFGFTLVNGVETVLNMLLLSTIGIIIFMGFGFIVSGLAKNESVVPPLANIITLPQFLLSGTFFSVENFPQWLQPISKALPLTYLNDAMRKVAFEGAGLGDVGHQLLILGIWGVIVYGVAVKVFKWE
ncbi:MAG: ABC transporter permease [Mucilaginibacter polytrichastri]|nr:ABC transporter permease [Mucilaginibacter polytrichastri]